MTSLTVVRINLLLVKLKSVTGLAFIDDDLDVEVNVKSKPEERERCYTTVGSASN